MIAIMRHIYREKDLSNTIQLEKELVLFLLS